MHVVYVKTNMPIRQEPTDIRESHTSNRCHSQDTEKNYAKSL